jgi:tetratricopeptide (TPR) repeat protein
MGHKRPRPIEEPRQTWIGALAPWAGLVALLVGLVVWAPSLGGGFLYDDVHATDPAVRDLHNLRAVLLFEPARPVLTLTWAFTYALAGPQPWAYHLGNIALHALNAWLLAGLFAAIGRRLAWPLAREWALIGACLFAAHPMAAEAVGYVASRSSVLAALFTLATLRLMLEALTTKASWRLPLGLVTFLVALATKEEAAALPLLLLLLDFVVVSGQKVREVMRHWRIHAPFLALVALGVMARRLVTGAWLPPAAVDHGRYLLTQWVAFFFYFLRAVVPVDPALYRGVPLAPWPPDASTLIAGLATLVLLVSAWRARREHPVWFLAVLWMGACLLPSSSLAPLQEMVVDHRAYLGMAIACLGLGACWRPGRGPWRTALVAAALVILVAISLRYQWVLADPVRAWEDAVARAPSAGQAWRSLGESYLARGDEAGAERALRRACQVQPADFRNWTQLGVFLAARDRLAEAETALREAARLAPAVAQLHENLALVLEREGRSGEAQQRYEEAMRLDPGFAAPQLDLARLLGARGERARALELLDAAARLSLNEHDSVMIKTLRDRLTSETPVGVAQ